MGKRKWGLGEERKVGVGSGGAGKERKVGGG